MKLGAEPKKLVILGALLLLAGYFFYSNVLSNPAGPPQEARNDAKPASQPVAAQPVPTPAAEAKSSGPSLRRAGTRGGRGEEFHPNLKLKPEERPDPSMIDPTLRKDLLAKVQGVELAGGARSLFQFSTPPPPEMKGKEPVIQPKAAFIGPKPPPEVKPPTPPPVAPPVPINLKYYGFSLPRGTGRKTAFFLDGEDILIAAEGDLVKKRYRVVRIGVNTVVMEDTESKSQQTLPLTEEVVG